MRARSRAGQSGARGVLLAALAAAAVAGCFADPTEVVVVVDTDARPFQDFGQVTFDLGSPFSPGQGGAFANAAPMPVTLGVTPAQGSTTSAFDVTVTLMNLTNGGFFLRRKVSNVPFVSGQMRTLFIPMLSICACIGTSCPHALDAQCRDITAPVLTSFDEGNIPRLPPTATATTTSP
jgi:hypothetical protein